MDVDGITAKWSRVVLLIKTKKNHSDLCSVYINWNNQPNDDGQRKALDVVLHALGGRRKLFSPCVSCYDR